MTVPSPAGDPVDMSQFRLGPRYGSEDMYRDFPHLRRGDLVSVEIGGVLYTDTLDNMTGKPPVYPTLPWWHRALRAITPRRWRKPLQPIQTDPVARQSRMLQNIVGAVEQLTKG